MSYTVLIALDGSPLAEHSLTYLPALAQLGEVKLHLLSVLDETEEIHDLSTADVVDRERKVLSAYLHEVASGIEMLHSIKPAIETGVGVPGEVIQRRAAELKPDLMVITTHGRSGISRWRRGSVAARLLHNGSGTILIVGPHAAARQGDWREGEAVTDFKSILVPLDGSELAEHALNTAAEIAQQFDSTIHLVRVVRPPLMSTGPQASHDPQENAANYLADIGERLHGHADVKTSVQIGSVDDELEQYIIDQKVDLVVMTSHGRSGLVRAALGSITDRLTGLGRAPVLVVRAPD